MIDENAEKVELLIERSTDDLQAHLNISDETMLDIIRRLKEKFEMRIKAKEYLK